MSIEKSQNSITEKLAELREQLYDVSARNPFIHINQSKLYFSNSSESSEKNKLEKIYRKQQFYLKEYGLETTLSITLFIKWKLPSKTRFYCSPLLYKPVRLKRTQKITLEHEVIEETELWQVNPVIESVFARFFDLELLKEVDNPEVLIQQITQHFNTEQDAVEVSESLSELERWEIISTPAVGTFNYKKSVLGLDYEQIINSPNTTIKEILGFNQYLKKESVKNNLEALPLDSSQKEVVARAVDNSLVIQGPPGTGKSHTIVSLIQHYTRQGKKVLFVSEKKSALEVVYQRMGTLKQWVAYFDAEDKPKKSFYKSLKKSFEAVLEPEERPEAKDLSFELYQSNSLSYPAQYIAPGQSVKASLYDLECCLTEAEFKNTDYHHQSQVPDFNSWQMFRDDLLSIERIALKKWSINSIGQSPFLQMNPAVLQEEESVGRINKRLLELKEIVQTVQAIQMRFNLTTDWDTFIKYCISASILNMVNKDQMDILLKGSKLYKSFDNWAKKYQLTKARLKKTESLNTLWEKQPSIAEIDLYEIQMNTRGWFSGIKRRNFHQQFFKPYKGNVPLTNAGPILENLKKEHQVYHELQEIIIKLKHNLKIFHPDKEIDNILEIRKRLEGLSHDSYQVILERENTGECISTLADMHVRLGNFNRIKSYLFRDELPQKTDGLLQYINAFNSSTGLLQEYLPEVKLLLGIPSKILRFIRLNPFLIAELEYKIYYHTWQKEKRFEPYLGELTGASLLKDINHFNKLKNLEFKKITGGFSNYQRRQWKDREKISSSPNAKLTEAEKALKQNFKQSKRVIVHEINKQQRHLPVKTLFDEADDILLMLQPVWMMNPLAISERLPIKENIFDVVIFDESSQIPLEDAIPTLFRAKNAVIVGDSQQMPPGQFFSSKTDSVSLLDQAEPVYPSTMLKWHYRSQHPDLISFSNQHFYDNQLQLFPPTQSDYPIKFHYIKNGVFDQNVNEMEAAAIATRLSELIKETRTDIAVIAFSLEQEKCIRKAITKTGLELPDTVLIRNLENVQGIEKEIVLISIGYAKNAEGKLRLNFGPVNQNRGENRLNVLFTRAISGMEVFSSIVSSDISLGDNKGVMVLKDFLNRAQQKAFTGEFESEDPLTNIIHKLLSDSGVNFSFYAKQQGLILSCFIHHDSKKILLVNPGVDTEVAMDLSAVIAVLKKQFKSIKIVLNNDWISSPDRVKKDVVDFFA